MSRIRPHHSKIAPCTHPVLPRHWFGICFRASVRAPEKRFLVSGGSFSWKEADAYPATCLADRLPVPSLGSDAPGPDTDLPSTGTISNSTINAVRRAGEGHAWSHGVYPLEGHGECDEIDSFKLLALEKTWA